MTAKRKTPAPEPTPPALDTTKAVRIQCTQALMTADEQGWLTFLGPRATGAGGYTYRVEVAHETVDATTGNIVRGASEQIELTGDEPLAFVLAIALARRGRAGAEMVTYRPGQLDGPK